MKNITLSADEKLIEKARERARKEHTTLNQRFREWLEDYSGFKKPKKDEILKLLDELSTTTGGPFTREEMNERR